MEHLNYSLWFTLVWLCFMFLVFLNANHRTVFTRAFTFIVIPPLIVMLIEYLIMR